MIAATVNVASAAVVVIAPNEVKNKIIATIK